MKKRINILWKVTLSLLLVFTSIGVFKQVPSIFAAEQLEVKEEIIYNEENTQATISLDLESISETYNIQDVIDPEGISLGTGIVSYLVDKNDTYKFDIVYLENGKEYTYEKEVMVDDIVDIKDTTNTNVTSPISIVNDIFPRSSVSDGDVTLNIPDYDESTGWRNGLIKKVSVVVDFKDSTSADKEITIDLPEGMKYTTIYTAGNPVTTGVDTAILSPYTSGSAEEKAIIGMTLPKKETDATGGFTKIGSTYGTLKINVASSTEKITIDVYVRVDAARYYREMQIPGDITASASKAGVEIGSISQSVKAVGANIATDANGYRSVNSNETTTVYASTDDEENYGVSVRSYMPYVNYTAGLDLEYGSRTIYVKEMKQYVYYPEGTEFAGFSALSTSLTYENDPDNSRVIITGIKTNGDHYGQVKYKIPKDAATGTVFSNPRYDYIEIEYYDGYKVTLTADNMGRKHSSTVVDMPNESLKLTFNRFSNTGITGMNNASEDYHAFASFYGLTNKNQSSVKNQVVEFDIDSNWLVSRVNIPFDGTASGDGITSVKYKTNKSPDVWIDADLSKLIVSGTQIRILTKANEELDEDEFFIAVKAEVGNFNSGYNRTVYQGSSSATGGTIATYGRLAQGTTSATVTMSIYEKGKEAETKQSLDSTINNSRNETKYVYSGDSTVKFYNTKGTLINSIVAGDTFSIKAEMRVSYYYATTMTSGKMINPEIYIRQPEGTTIDIDSIVIKGGTVVHDDWTISDPYYNDNGDMFYKITTKNFETGFWYGEEPKNVFPTIQYNISTNITYTDSYNGQDLVAWGKDGYANAGTSGTYIIDTYDFNGNDNLVETLFSFNKTTFEVQKNEKVLIDTYLTLKGEEPKEPYSEGNANTLAYFTPGTEADYTAKIINNSGKEADSLTMYIPIPKEGENFGGKFQSSAFKWNMRLTDLLGEEEGFDISYATTANESNYTEDEIYSGSGVNLDEVNMVRIKTTAKIPADVELEFKVPLMVDEDMESADEGNKISTRNIFNPVYAVETEGYRGTLEGTKVGTELVIAEISGTVFVDKDGDGLYNNEDTPIQGHEVKLYKMNESNVYEPVMKDSTQVLTTTNENGEYFFDYNQGLGYGTYAVEFAELEGNFEYTINNTSNRSIDSDALPTGVNRGKAIGIDATKPAATTIGCGFIEYDPDSAMDVTLSTPSENVKVGSTITIDSTIEPSFFENIKDATTPYTWEFVSASDTSKATIRNNNDGSATITPEPLESGTTSVQIILTIKDIYGNTKISDPITITIISNTPPTLSATPMEKYVGDTVNWLYGFSAKNNETEDIEIKLSGDDANTTINSSSVPTELGVLTTPGTYSVSYTVSDSYNNKATITRLVKVHGVPVISANTQSYVVSDSDIAGSVQSSGSAVYMQAGDNVGDTPEEESIPVTYTISNGPSTTDFSKVGLYKVTYSAIIGTVTRTKTADVLVKSEDMVIENDLAIDANNIALTQTEAKAFDLDKAIAKADVKAFEYTRQNGDITGVDSLADITISSIDDIKNVTEKGGEYKVTFTATGTSGTITKEILVVVEGTEIQENDGIVVKAKGITLANTDTIDATSAKLGGEVSAYLLKDKTAVIEIEVNEAELTNINNVGLSGATKDLTFTAKDDGKSASIVVDVVVSPTLVGPTITANACEHYVGDTFNVLHGVSAVDATNTTIKLDTSEENKNTNVTHSIPNDEDKFTTAGTYNVTIEVTDQFGNSSTATKLVKVNGLPEITAVAQEYNVSSSTIDADIIAAATASYLKANDVVGNAMPTTITGVTYTVSSGPSADFTEVGPYVVKYSVENDGKTATKEVSVLITDDTSLTENDLSIRGDNIVLTQEEAKEFTEDTAITAADVKAYEYTKTDNVITGIDTLSEITSSDVTSIKNVTEEGGEYKVTFTATGTSGTITKEILVVVEGTEIQENNGIVVKAKGFTIANTETETINESLSQTKGRVSAYLLKNENEVDDIVTKAEELAAIKAVGLAGDTKPLTFTAEAYGKTSEITINVVVSPTLQQPTITANDCEYYVGDPINILDGVSAEDALGANIPLVLDESVTYTTTIKGTLIYTTPGTYTTEYIVTDSYGNAQTASRTTKVNGLPSIDVYNQAYNIDDASIQSQVESAATASYLKASDTVGNTADFTDITTNIEVRLVSGPSNDYSEAGLYKVEYKVVQGGKTEIKVVDVLVISQGTQENDDLSINAENIVLTHAEAKAVTKEDIVNKANAVAYDYTKENGNITKTEEVTSKITVSNLEDIKKVGETGNEFTVTLEVKQGDRSVSMNILVVVEGTEIQEDNGIVVKAKSFELANADAKNADITSVISDATASAYELKTLDAVSTITTDTSQLDGIKNSGLPGGTYPLTITATKDSDGVSIEVEVTVKPTVIKPDVTINDVEYYVGDEFLSLDGVSATDAHGEEITLSELSTRSISNTVIRHNMPLENGKLTTPGTYQLTYEISDRYGNVQTSTRIVKVHGLPEINADSQLYMVSDKQILEQVKNAISASYLQAQDTVGAQPLSVDLTGDVKVEVVSGPNGTLDFSAIGVYQIAYTVTNIDGKETTTTIDVMVQGDESTWDSTKSLLITGSGFNLTQKEAKDLTIAEAIVKGDVKAFEAVRDENGNIIAYNDISNQITAYSDNIKSINKVTTAGGVFDLVFEAKQGDKSVSKLVKVTVEGTSTPPVIVTPDGYELGITARDFTIEYQKSLLIDTNQAMVLAQVEAYLLNENKEIITTDQTINIKVNGKELEAIRNGGKNGGTYKLTFTAEYTASNGEVVTNTSTIDVTVLKEHQTNPSVAPGNTTVDTSDSTNIMFYLGLGLVSILLLMNRKKLLKR
ncbi:SdrD B-like domain-containing protein [Breznakia pachnodae]|uniref:SD-repeat containing protein B domain-containing protein n=1 Tax=Breznakia pachnodae TaxID=265178 RepID=A0ABU0E502_9FIRM|nr:SdrD B-like domain-containing protein [Breznakia pachnodae]MDQ0361789.1 hypothetical protein [Breznakia pachnodae]